MKLISTHHIQKEVNGKTVYLTSNPFVPIFSDVNFHAIRFIKPQDAQDTIDKFKLNDCIIKGDEWDTVKDLMIYA